MKKVKIKRLLFIVLIITISCGQNKKNREMVNYKKEIRKLATYELISSPLYLIRHSISGGLLEISINKKIILKNHEFSVKSQKHEFINHLLKRNNKQEVSIKMFPPVSEKFDSNSSFSLELSKFESKDNWDNWIDDNQQTIILKYNTNDVKKKPNGFPLTENGKFRRKVNIEGLLYFEKKIEFEAEMPFENEVLLNGKELSKLDSKTLEEKVLLEYQRFANSVENKEENIYWKMYYSKIAYFSKANFLTKKDIDDLIKEGEMYYNKMSYLPIENYEMKFYDEGRLVCFESKSNELEFKGKSPLVATAVNPKNPSDVFKNPVQFYFYMPKDSDELKIMY
ncbi:MAG: hypothetical protein JKY08_05110 [Flavobacteriaceae bacterium]|nr:hypothetical protein [Flavobacteriaceae bacterium]